MTSLSYTQFFKLNIADSSLGTTILELVWWRNAEFLADKVMASCILRIACQKTVLNVVHLVLDSFVHNVVWQWRLSTYRAEQRKLRLEMPRLIAIDTYLVCQGRKSSISPLSQCLSCVMVKAQISFPGSFQCFRRCSKIGPKEKVAVTL